MGTNADSSEKAEETEIDGTALSEVIGRISGLVANWRQDEGLLQPADGEGPVQFLDRLAGEVESILADGLREANELQGQVDGLKRQLAAQKGQTTRARNEVEAISAQLPEKPRKIDAPKDPFKAADLIEAINDADEVQLLFSDGKAELAGIAPLSIGGGKAWRKNGDRVVLTAPSVAIAARGVDRIQQLKAYALMLDGEIVALRERHEPLRVKPNQRYELAGDVLF